MEKFLSVCAYRVFKATHISAVSSQNLRLERAKFVFSLSRLKLPPFCYLRSLKSDFYAISWSTPRVYLDKP